MLDNIDFAPFRILGADGQRYTGVRPSLIPKPFKGVSVVLQGKLFKPRVPDGYSVDQVLGFDAAIRIGMDLHVAGGFLRSNKAYRLVTLLKDGRRWSRLVYLNGRSEEGWL